VKVKTSPSTVQELADLLERFDASTEQFLDDLPTPEKYAVLTMALVVGSGYEDYEEAHDEATRRVSAQDLTRYLLNFPFLYCHLSDAVRLGWDYVEFPPVQDDCDEDKD
jgi:hypothetical protein